MGIGTKEEVNILPKVLWAFNILSVVLVISLCIATNVGIKINRKAEQTPDVLTLRISFRLKIYEFI